MKLVALDVGEKRIGVATADSTVKIAVPRGVIEVDGDELVQIAGILKDEGAKHLIVGLPRNARGEETAQSKAVRDFVAVLQDYFMQNKIERPLVKFQDESLTSVIAEERLKGKKSKRRQKKADIDSEAAAIILQDFLNSFGGEPAIATQDKKKTKMKGRGKVKRGAFRVFAVLVGLLIVAAVGVVTYYAEMLKPVVRPEECTAAENESVDEKCKSLTFVVAENEATNDIVDRLEFDGLIRSALVFKIYLRLNHSGAVLRAGSYELNSQMEPAEIIEKLNTGAAAETFRITFLPGGTVADAKKVLGQHGYSGKEIEAGFAASFEHPVLEGRTSNSLEGYIYGETYEFYATATVEDILMRTFDELYKVVQENDLVAKYKAKGLSLYQGLVLASIIQKEAHAADMPQVAQVFLLRLERDIPLGSCAVIGYEADRIDPNRDSTDMSYLDTIKDCPWASRICQGLPPNPISNPGKAALLAVGSPASGSYVYFLTGDDGTMHYAYTEAEHETNIKNYCKVMCNYL